MTDETVDITSEEREYSLEELSNLADVTPRTVRYYIVEGLLPPPLTTGRNATYSQEHLDRLNAIASLKEMYLPLREIRHRLNTLTAEQMRDPAYLASLSQAVAMDRAMGKRHGRHGRRGAHRLHDEARHDRRRRRPQDDQATVPTNETDATESSPQTWERIPLGEDAELLIRSSKARNMGPHLYRMLHRIRHMIEHEDRYLTHRERTDS